VQEDLDDLANSIRDRGIIQPLIVRSIDKDQYEIVAGERRWRAAQMAQQHEVPVLVRDFSDVEVLEVAIIENIQRADLNPVDEAAGYRQLMDRFGHTQEKLSEAMGKSRSHIANLIRLLNLPNDVQDLLRDGRLSAGHARALITSDNPSVLAARVINNGLSVRGTEEMVRKQAEGPKPKTKSPSAQSKNKDADTKALEGDLSASMGMKVEISHKPGQEAGSVTINYKNLEELDALCQILGSF
jgi:ParB family chromosome partitioning protein